jgi:predicted flap endonuclease-1-like 5' DNA nuclease
MGYKIEEIESIGPVYAEKLGAAGIGTTADLMRISAAGQEYSELLEAAGGGYRQGTAQP